MTMPKQYTLSPTNRTVSSTRNIHFQTWGQDNIGKILDKDEISTTVAVQIDGVQTVFI